MSEVRPRAAVLATLAAVALATSAYLEWWDDRTPREIPLRTLGLQDAAGVSPTSYWDALAAPLALVGALGVLGALMLSRLVLWVTFLLGLATVALWSTSTVLEQGAAEFTVRDVGVGGWIALGAVVVQLVSAAALRRRGEEEDDDAYLAAEPVEAAEATTVSDSAPARRWADVDDEP